MSYFALEPSWELQLREELSQPYISRLAAFVARERLEHPPIYPPEGLVFNAFLRTPYDAVSVVIVGQDPYHGPGQAHGLSFSVPKGVAIPPSLKNVYKEICDDLGGSMPSHGCLLGWAEQGVLLLNTVLTVRHQVAHSHKGKGWELFTNSAIAALSRRKEPVVFFLWGQPAQEKSAFIDLKKGHLVLRAAHPSPFSASNGFFGCRHFSAANRALVDWGRRPIDWHNL